MTARRALTLVAVSVAALAAGVGALLAKGDVRLCGVVVSIDEATGRALTITRLNELIPEMPAPV